MGYGDFKEVQGVASGDGNEDAKASTTYVKKYEQNSTDKILNSPMFQKATNDIKKSKEEKNALVKKNKVIDSHISNLRSSGGSTLDGWEKLTSDEKTTALLNKDTQYLNYPNKR